MEGACDLSVTCVKASSTRFAFCACARVTMCLFVCAQGIQVSVDSVSSSLDSSVSLHVGKRILRNASYMCTEDKPFRA